MIELSINGAFMLYLSLTIFFLISQWTWQHYYTQRKKSLPAQQNLYVCEYCHFAYLYDSQKKINQCPQCKSYNRENQFKNLNP